MNFVQRIKLYVFLAKGLITKSNYNLNYFPDEVEEGLFVTAAQAARLIPSGSTVISAGMAAHARCSIFFWAVRDAFLKNKKPENLTWISVAGQGGRGQVSGTVEEVGISGLLTEYISAHVETVATQLRLGEKKEIEIHTIPQGEISAIIDSQGIGQNQVESETGINTFIDPACGGGTAVTPHSTKSYVKRDGDKLVYSLPEIDVALFNAPYADSDGNIYFKNASAITEMKEAALAARFNGGKVIATVCKIIEKDESAISLASGIVDHIVVNPLNEQAAIIKQKKYWSMFTEGASVDVGKAIEKLRTINRMLLFSPKRGDVENTLARMAASLFVNEAEKGDLVNIGVGLPEEVGRLVYEGGLFNDLVFSSEAGVYGGLPTPGIYFGGAINPQKLCSSAWIFEHYKNNLKVAVLGMLQVDSSGNVNVSKKGDGVRKYVGPGGFMDITESAKTIIFVGTWMAKARFSIKDGKLKIIKKGIPKFVDSLHEVTFNAQEALKKGKRVFYVTTVGIFRLTENGPELIKVMPGIDVEKDVKNTCTARVQVSDDLEILSENITTGKNFRLSWE